MAKGKKQKAETNQYLQKGTSESGKHQGVSSLGTGQVGAQKKNQQSTGKGKRKK